MMPAFDEDNQDPQDSSHFLGRTGSINNGLRTSRATTEESDISPNDANFLDILEEHGIFAPFSDQKNGEFLPSSANHQDLRRVLAQRRPSIEEIEDLSARLREFRLNNRHALSESSVTADILPDLCGTEARLIHPRASNHAFDNIAMIDSRLTTPQPAKFYGIKHLSINKHVREELREYIIPSEQTSSPAAPNFFLEAKGREGSPQSLFQQAIYNGTIGARTMLHLQNYSNSGDWIYDDNAYCLSATFHPVDGLLTIYATYPRACNDLSAGYDTEYITNYLGVYTMLSNEKQFRRGLNAYRNARDYCLECLQNLTEAANEIAEGAHPKTP